MLTDTALKNLKSKEKTYKVADRDGMYAEVERTGVIVFRLDYRLHGRRETLTLGQYGRNGITLAQARERCIEARKVVKDGQSPAQNKQREKRRLAAAHSFGDFGEAYFKESKMAESTREMRRHIYDRDIAPAWNKRLLVEIRPEDLRALCKKVKERGRLRPPSMFVTLSNRSSASPFSTARELKTQPTLWVRHQSRHSKSATGRCLLARSELRFG
jgi:hypothetical protein